MAATRIYSTAAYYVAGVVAILFGLCPKFGALVAADPGRRARRHHRRALRHDRPARREDLDREPGRLRRTRSTWSRSARASSSRSARWPTRSATTSRLEGIALGTIVLLAGYHLLRWLAPAYMRDALDRRRRSTDGTASALERTGATRRRSARSATRRTAGTRVPPSTATATTGRQHLADRSGRLARVQTVARPRLSRHPVREDPRVKPSPFAYVGARVAGRGAGGARRGRRRRQGARRRAEPGADAQHAAGRARLTWSTSTGSTELAYVRVEDGAVRVGALARHADGRARRGRARARSRCCGRRCGWSRTR